MSIREKKAEGQFCFLLMLALFVVFFRLQCRTRGDKWHREDFKNAKWWKKLWLFAVDGLSNKRGEGHIPDDILRDLARLLLPQIIQMYESEEGKKQLEEWKAEQEKQKNAAISKSKSEG